MTQFVSNIIQNSLSGFVSGAVTTAGGYVGDAISSAGDMLEKKGQTIGDAGIAKTVDGWGQGISGYYGGGKGNTSVPAKKTSPATRASIQTKDASPQPKSSSRVGKASSASVPRRAASIATAPKAANSGSTVAMTGSGGKVNATRPAARRVKSTDDTGTRSKPARRAAIPKPTPSSQLSKPSTNTAGKVVPSRNSLPGNKSRASSTPAKTKPVVSSSYGGPIPIGGSGFKPAGGYTPGRDFKPHGGYEGPLNLKGVAGNKPGGNASSGNASLAPKYKSSGYQGPLNLG